MRARPGRAARSLRADYLVAPIGLDRPPLLSWEPPGRQSAYRLECLAVGADPSEVTFTATATSLSPLHRLEMPLRAATEYRWRVQTSWDGDWDEWSPWATFETALLTELDWCHARWIGSASPGPAPILGRTFRLSKVARPRLYVCGLGVANVSINDRPVGAGVLDPPPSAFDATVWYRAFDLSGLVGVGLNAMKVLLGRGYYAMSSDTAFNWHIAPWRSEPKLRALLVDLDDPAEPLLSTSDAWDTQTSCVLDDSFYTGEVQDFNAPSKVGSAVLVEPPAGTLRPCQQAPVTRRESIRVVRHTWTGEDRQRFDLEKNVAGMLNVGTDDPSRPTLLVKLGEKLGAGGEVLAADGAVHGELQRSELIAVPADQPAALDLTYAGVRYVEVKGSRERARVQVDRVSAAPESIGMFCCSDDRLNAIHALTRATVENCLQAIPVDTPLYEKQGYTGDAQLLCETFAYNYWMPTYLASWLEASVLPSQSADGSMPGIAPTPPGNWIFDTPSPAWDAALFELPSTLLRHYRDERTVRIALPVLRRYLDYLARRFPSGIVSAGLGDWNPPGHNGKPPETPAVLSTAYYFRFLRLMSGFLQTLGRASEATLYLTRAQVVRDAFNSKFWNEGGFYTAPDDASYRETNNVVAVAFGLADSPRRDVAVARILAGLRRRDMHLDTGIVGTRFLLPVLSRAGHSGAAFEVVRRESYPSWLYWLNQGATTLYENWELARRSHNHAMFGTVDEWFYRDVAGLSPGSDGWQAVELGPHFPADHRFQSEATVETLTGTVKAEWEKVGAEARGTVWAPAHVPVSVRVGRHLSETKRRTSRVDGYTHEHSFVLALH